MKKMLLASARGQDFSPLAEAKNIGYITGNPDAPCVLRGLGKDWPAIRKWRFAYLGSLAPALPVQLVAGNRERGLTRFVASTLGDYLAHLQNAPQTSAEPRQLKEFDLLKIFPQLREDLRPTKLFPHGAIVSSSAWISESGARTGLHFDRLHNLALQVSGRKRFYLASPGTVEALDQVSNKYDRWACLSRIGINDLAAHGASTGALYVVDLLPGDALYMPKRWWHEVVTLEPSILLSGFFDAKAGMLRQWLCTGAIHSLHRAGLWRRNNCVCHPAPSIAVSSKIPI
ncbi:MAG: cupin-like domain-containing protein [Collimonas sp.]|uniref:cupin-like domain-containing protein n=1 Tax=Collimonas sp. TaxID=1963772 RepID=UPI0032665CC1